ncbi:MAG: lycopene cyclase domain-containing protein [Leptospira sp.]|nr:lycopene cyclase domain-containing protein [Leptospira sp.]
MMISLAIYSIPFAFTERYFYPTYWEPDFLWNLVEIFGFGIEDLIFVIGLSGFSSTVYAVVFQKRLYPIKQKNYTPSFILILLFLIITLAVLIFVYLEIHLIYGAPALMFFLYLGISIKRKDLLFPGIIGGILSCLVYTLLCYAIFLIYPNIFEITWHTEKFLNLKLFFIPIEELIYSFTSGCVATVFYPVVYQTAFKNFE